MLKTLVGGMIAQRTKKDKAKVGVEMMIIHGAART